MYGQFLEHTFNSEKYVNPYLETNNAIKKCESSLIVTLPNFGDEKGVAEAIKRSGLSVPVQAEPDVGGQDEYFVPP
jgi:L-fucose isomerase-like protein